MSCPLYISKSIHWLSIHLFHGRILSVCGIIKSALITILCRGVEELKGNSPLNEKKNLSQWNLIIDFSLFDFPSIDKKKNINHLKRLIMASRPINFSAGPAKLPLEVGWQDEKPEFNKLGQKSFLHAIQLYLVRFNLNVR